MKNTSKLWLSALVLTASIYGCTKDPLTINSTETTLTSSESNSSSRFLTLTQDEYDNLKVEITRAFEGEQKSSQRTPIDLTNFTPNSSTVIPVNLDDMYAENGVDEVVKINEAVIAKFSNLANHQSMLTIYNEALQIKDETKIRSFVKKHNYFLTYMEEFNSVLLSVPKYKAVLLNPYGIIKIGDNIIQYTDENIKIIKNGDPDLISSLSSTTKSNENIEVLKLGGSSNKSFTRVKSVQATKLLGPNHPHNLFAVIVVKYVDSEAYTHTLENHIYNPATGTFNIDFNTSAIRYNVGTQIFSFFNGVPNYTEITVTSLSSYQGGSVSTDGSVTANNLVGVAFHPYNNVPDNETPLPLSNFDINLFAVVSGWNVKYANGVVFQGVE